MPVGPCTLEIGPSLVALRDGWDLAAEIGMPAVVDFQFLPDMGRMNGQWRSTARTHLFAGSDGGAEHWATIASLIETRKLNDIDPLTYLTDVLDQNRQRSSQ